MSMRIRLTINGRARTALLGDSPAARALAAALPAAWSMKELNGNEKYVYLPQSLPAAPRPVRTIRAGSLMLYGTDCLVLFYRSFPTAYAYTPLGQLEDAEGIDALVGRGTASVTAAPEPCS